MKHRFVELAIVSVFAALLAGCSTYSSVTAYLNADKAILCPDAAILATTSSLPAFAPTNGGDPSGVIYSVAMTNVKTRCSYDKQEKTADARTRVMFHAARAPGGTEVSYRVPYFLAVSEGGEIIAKNIYWIDLEFAAGATATDGEALVESTIVTVEKGKNIYDYHFLTGFQLTKAQLDYNKKIGPYEP